MGYGNFLKFSLIAAVALSAGVSVSAGVSHQAMAAATRVDVANLPVAEALTQLTADPAVPDPEVVPVPDPEPDVRPDISIEEPVDGLPMQKPSTPDALPPAAEPVKEQEAKPAEEVKPAEEMKAEPPKAGEVSDEEAKAEERKPIKNKKKKAKLKDAEEKPEVEDAKTLKIEEVLAEVYSRNPELQAARAELRAVDETYAQAFSGFRPVVTADASVSSTHDEGDVTDSHSDPKAVGVGLSQSIYSGGSTMASMRASSNTIKAQRALLHLKEQEVLLAGVSAYLDVLRDQEILRSNRNNVDVLSQRLKESRERLRLGDITRTDVSQAESRLAQATAEKVAAEGFLKSSRAAFERVSGLTADNLKRPTAKLALPGTLDEAQAQGDRLNPAITYTQYSEKAASATTRSIQGELYPQVGLDAGVDRTYDPLGGNDHSTGTAVTLRATLPLYSGGATASRIRQSRQVESQRRIQVRQAGREVKEQVTNAWAALVSARAQAEARAAQVQAAGLARKNVKAEAEYGSRTTLDLLDAEQEYRNARVAQAVADHDAQLAAYGLLASMGRLTAQELGLASPLYDPTKNFQKVKNKWFGTQIEAVE